MLDFAVSLALPETIGLFCANEDAEMKAMLKSLKFAQSPLKAQNMPLERKVLLLQAPQAPGTLKHQEAFIDGI